MLSTRKTIGGLGNSMFRQAYLWGQYREGNIPDIYMQGEVFWKKYKDEIKEMFNEGIGHIDMVSIQLRRGDYVGNPFYIDLSKTNFYQEAVKYFPDDKFLVFCHDNQDPEIDKKDKEWARNFLDSFIEGRYEINTPGSETDDMNKMASCKHNIIANSSYGWWAAYLNPNPDKKVICPKKWFSDGFQRCELLEEWTLI